MKKLLVYWMLASCFFVLGFMTGVVVLVVGSTPCEQQVHPIDIDKK